MTDESEFSKVQEVFMDGNIAGMAPDVATIVNRHFWEHQLDPYMGSVEFEDGKLELTVSAYFRGEEYDDAKMQEIVDTIVDAVERRGIRGVKGQGYHSEVSGDALVCFEQEL